MNGAERWTRAPHGRSDNSEKLIHRPRTPRHNPPVHVFLNGRFVPEAEAVVSVFDRSFLYGDGLFETLRVQGGRPVAWREHLERLERGAEFLRLRVPFTRDQLGEFAGQLIAMNQMPEAVLRLTLSRGRGPRGYSPRGADQPVLVMTLHPAPVIDLLHPLQWRLITASVRLPAGEALAQFKTCNKLPQILARAEADEAGADEALLLNTDGFLAEAASSNLFWIANGAVCTPPVEVGLLPGVTRGVVLGLCGELGLPIREISVRPEELRRAEGLFLTLSTLGVVEAVALDGAELARSPLVAAIRAAHEAKVRAASS